MRHISLLCWNLIAKWKIINTTYTEWFTKRALCSKGYLIHGACFHWYAGWRSTKFEWLADYPNCYNQGRIISISWAIKVYTIPRTTLRLIGLRATLYMEVISADLLGKMFENVRVIGRLHKLLHPKIICPFFKPVVWTFSTATLWPINPRATCYMQYTSTDMLVQMLK